MFIFILAWAATRGNKSRKVDGMDEWSMYNTGISVFPIYFAFTHCMGNELTTMHCRMSEMHGYICADDEEEEKAMWYV